MSQDGRKKEKKVGASSHKWGQGREGGDGNEHPVSTYCVPGSWRTSPHLLCTVPPFTFADLRLREEK